MFVNMHETRNGPGWRLAGHGTHEDGKGGWIVIANGNDSLTLHYQFAGNMASVLRAALAQIDANCDDDDDGVDPTTCAGSDHDPDGSRANARTVKHEEET